MAWNTGGQPPIYKQNKFTFKGHSKLLWIILIAFVAIITLSASARTVDTGTVGVIKRFGRVTGTVLDPGLHFIVPYTDSLIIYNTKDIVYEVTPEDKQAGSKADYIDYPVDSTTKDGQQVLMSYSVRFHIVREETVRIANELGPEAAAVEKVVKFHSRVIARQVPRNYEASELYTGDVAKVQQDIEDQLRGLFAAKGLYLDAFGIREITFSNDYIQAVEQKQIEREKVITESHRAEQAEYRKQATITEAQGEAEAIRLRGEALRQNPDIVQLEFVNAIRDPNSKVKLIIVPSTGLLPVMTLNGDGDISNIISEPTTTPSQ